MSYGSRERGANEKPACTFLLLGFTDQHDTQVAQLLEGLTFSACSLTSGRSSLIWDGHCHKFKLSPEPKKYPGPRTCEYFTAHFLLTDPKSSIREESFSRGMS